MQTKALCSIVPWDIEQPRANHGRISQDPRPGIQGLQQQGPPKADDCCGDLATKATLEPSMADFGAFRGPCMRKSLHSGPVGGHMAHAQAGASPGMTVPRTWFCPWRSPSIRELLSQLCKLCGDRSLANKVYDALHEHTIHLTPARRLRPQLISGIPHPSLTSHGTFLHCKI